MANIVCPSCRSSVPGAGINIDRMIAKCAGCSHVFAFEGQVARPVAPLRPHEDVGPLVRLSHEWPRPTKPQRFVVEGQISTSPPETDYRTLALRQVTPLVIRWRWFGAQALFLLFFAIAWDSFLLFWYATGISAGGPWIMFVFPLAHVAAGVAITYQALSKLLNVTTVTVDHDRLRVHTGPIRLPFRPQLDIARSDVRQLSVLEKHGSKGSISFSVLVHDQMGTAHTLATCDASQEAKFLERAIELHLGIPDDPWMNQVER